MNHLRVLALTTSLLVVVMPAAAETADMYSALRSAPVHTDLPTGEKDSGTALVGRMRPQLAYPTLRLDEREPRQAPQPAPQAAPPAANDAPRPVSDFDLLVRQTLGQSLPVFGHELFAAASGFEALDRAAVPAEFVIAPGDEIYLRAWGSVELDYRATVDRSGSIAIPKVGEVPVAGVRFGQLREHLRAAIARSFHGFELSVSLGQLHSIQIYVTGFARTPGSYTVNGLSTLINALFYAGGPDRAGDLRRIELHRDGVLQMTVDLYDFLLDGAYDNDLRLLPGDVIHIPPLHGQAAVAGAVNRPGIYQMLPGDTLGELLAFAGDLGVSASNHRLVLERIGDDDARVVKEMPLTAASLALPLQNGDLVLVQPVSPRFHNAVTLRGHVAQPLRHEWRAGMRVSDLLPSSDALISPHYWRMQNKREQVVPMLTSAPATGVAGELPDINWEYAVIERVGAVDLRTELLPFNLGKAVHARDPEHDLVLQPGDRITVFSLGDFRTRIAQQPRFVRIEGEVRRAGIYPVRPGETVADVIALAGGLTADSYLYGLELKRDAVRRQQRLRLDEAIDQLEQDYQRHLIERSRNVLTGDLSLAITPEAHAIQTLIRRLRDAEPSGRIVLDLDAATDRAGQLPALELSHGDTIYIPPLPATVEVVGAVFRQGSFLHGDKPLRHYVDRAGLLPTADKRHIYLIRPDGSFHRVDRGTTPRPGDTIIVPEKTDRESAVRRIKDWTQVLYQFGLGAAGLNLLDVF